MVDVDTLLALGIGRDHGAVGVEESFREKVVGLLGPDTEAGTIEDVHQGFNVGRCESPAEITRGSGVRNSLGTQGVEIDLVVAPKFKVFHSLTAGNNVKGNVQDMVGFVIGQMPFEKVEILIDTVDQANLLSQHENGADAAGTKPFDTIGVFVVDVGGGHHRFRTLGLADILETEANSPPPFLKDSLLASQMFFPETSSHSKASLVVEY
jgi:hypothetical protein